jgi:hypothetical protein
MYKQIFKSLVLSSFGILLAIPASADIRATLGELHIRIANDRPPQERYERRSERPDRDSVWIKGYWDRRDDKWDWIAGRWERPRDRNTHWVKARYQRDHSAWRYEPAHWSNEQLVEGDDYRQWHDEHRSDRDRHRN